MCQDGVIPYGHSPFSKEKGRGNVGGGVRGPWEEEEGYGSMRFL